MLQIRRRRRRKRRRMRKRMRMRRRRVRKREKRLWKKLRSRHVREEGAKKGEEVMEKAEE